MKVKQTPKYELLNHSLFLGNAPDPSLLAGAIKPRKPALRLAEYLAKVQPDGSL
jgi:hypothetical protein